MRSDKNVYMLGQLAIREGQADAFRTLADDMCAATAKEPGALNYEWSLSEDGTKYHVYERYVDSDAVRVHLENVAAHVERLMTLAEITRSEIYGSPDAELRKVLLQFGATFYQPYAGFVL